MASVDRFEGKRHAEVRLPDAGRPQQDHIGGVVHEGEHRELFYLPASRPPRIFPQTSSELPDFWVLISSYIQDGRCDVAEAGQESAYDSPKSRCYLALAVLWGEQCPSRL